MSSALSEEEKKIKILSKSIGTMVHEISHMFGIRHCVYYECTMNGSNGSFEDDRRPDEDICPLCLYKLKVNIKFDTKERYEKMLEVCKDIGLTKRAEKFEELL